MPFLLPKHPDAAFPPAAAAPAHGLLAVGGDLAPARLRNAYRHGIFPWFGEDDPFMWWSPDPRWVLYVDRISQLPSPATAYTLTAAKCDTQSQLGGFHVSRSLRRFLRHCQWTLSLDRDFAAVIEGCTHPRRDGDDTWITPDMRAAYIALAAEGSAHSLEVWDGDELIGGLYGVGVGGVFCAESMFSARSNASKVALLGLARNFAMLGGVLIDCQLHNPHIESLGVRPCSRDTYLAVLAEVRDRPDPLTGVLRLSQAAQLL